MPQIVDANGKLHGVPDPTEEVQKRLASKIAAGLQGELVTGSDISTLQITEVTGLRRSVELRGPALPFRGAAWKASMRLVTTWYAGNGVEATQQVLGTVELPSSWEGMWRRTLMGRTPSSYTTENGGVFKITTPAAMREIFEGEGGIFRSGARLRVVWCVRTKAAGSQSLATMVREGRCKEWEWPHDTAHDIGWKWDWEWQGRGTRQQRVVATRTEGLVSLTSASVLSMNDFVNFASLSPIQTSNRKIAHAPTNFTLGNLEALTQVPNALVTGLTRSLRQTAGQLGQIADIVAKVRAIPTQLLNSVKASAKNTVLLANRFVDKISARAPETNVSKPTLADFVRGATFFGKAAIAAQRVSRAATANLHELQTVQAAPPGSGGLTVEGPKSILAIKVVKQGDTLASLSVAYYGSPDHAVDIARANHLPWNQVSAPPGSILIIPLLKDGQGTG